MTVRRFLLYTPILLIIFLLQSYFWIPTFDQQSRGNPHRLNEYINASIGDASLLNPILSADASSGQIVSLVFEGLIDRDEDLRFRGRLARSWEIYEEAYFYVNSAAPVPGLGTLSTPAVLKMIEDIRSGAIPVSQEVKKSFDNIKNTEIITPPESTLTRKDITITLNPPSRIKLTLFTVDQHLFRNLSTVLGNDYFSSFNGEEYLRPDSQLVPELLKEYTQELLPATEHNPIVVFNLRSDVQFHDGHLFDAHDVAFTYSALMNPKNLSPRITDFEPVKGLEVLDPLTIRVIYKRLFSPALGTWSMGILPEHLLNDKTLAEEAGRLGKDPETFSIRQSTFNRQPIGCGPFVFKTWKSDQYILLDRFTDYWEGPPEYERYFFRIVPDPLTQEMEFYAGTIDSYAVQPHQVDRLENDPRFQSFSGLSFGFTYIGYNMRRAPFDDPRVRMALSMAIDVDQIIEFLLFGQGERITGPFVKQTDFYNHALDPVPYDPDGALSLLQEAGWHPNDEGWLVKDGKQLQFTLITNHGNDLRKALLAIAQDAWRKIGINVRTDLLEWSVFIQERVDKADFDAVILGWSMSIEPDLYQIWHSSQANPHQLNFVAFSNGKADDLIIKIRQEYDHEQQVAYSHQLHEIIASEQPYTFLYATKWTAVLDKRIVIRESERDGTSTYKRITPTKTGNYSFYFNKWIKLPELPTFASEG
jgi:ABC-type transport system substrate-binding protein